MMGDLEGHALWDEPLVGLLFGNLYYVHAAEHRDKRSEQFILGDHYRRSWLNSLKAFVMSEATQRFPGVAGNGHLVIKEPNGSIGAPLLMEAIPESRMVLLTRDPRDAVASSLKAHQKRGWLYESAGDATWKRDQMPDRQPDVFVRTWANFYLRHMSKTKQAFDAHNGRKAFIRYEDLRYDTLGVMKAVCSALEMPVQEEGLARVVEEHSWENIPEEEKGAGKFNRKATPGGWREDLTSEQAATVERITAPLLREFYPETAGD